MFGFPAYWVIWTYLYPQPYESLTLRLLGAFAAIPFIVEKWLPRRLREMIPLYGIFFCMMALPFFFSYMSLMNGANLAWQTSFIASFLYLALILDAVSFLACAILGTGLGMLTFHLRTGAALPMDFIEGWPVYLFVLSAGSVFNYAEALARVDSRLQSARALGGTIAHEMRTPLLGVRLDAAATQERLGVLLNDLELDAAERAEAEALTQALTRIGAHGRYADSVLSMLLMNLSGPRQPGDTRPVAMVGMVEDAVARFPFRGEEKQRLHLDLADDFIVTASPVLLVQVIHNLLRNALRAVAEAGRGDVTIRLVGGDRRRLIVRDTGIGIPPEKVTKLFRPFTTMWGGTAGIGLGLAFCKKAVEDMGGTISVTSLNGTFTEFEISFPASTSR